MIRSAFSLIFIFSLFFIEVFVSAQSPNLDGDVIILPIGQTRIKADGISQLVSLRPEYVQATYEGNEIVLDALKTGFASISYVQWQAQQNKGIAIKTSDDQAPGLPPYIAVGGRASIGNGQGTLDYDWLAQNPDRWMDVLDLYMTPGPDQWVYLSGGPKDTWNSKSWYPGKYLDNFVKRSKQLGRIPCIVFYCMQGADESVDILLQGFSSKKWMRDYYTRTIALIRDNLYWLTKDDQWPVMLIIEPDLLGYMSANVQADPNSLSIEYRGKSYNVLVSPAFEPGKEERYEWVGSSDWDGKWEPITGKNVPKDNKKTITFDTNPLLPVEESGLYPDTLKGFVESIPAILRHPFVARVREGQLVQNPETVKLGDHIYIGWKMNLWASPPPSGYTNINYPNPSIPFGVGKGICRWTDAAWSGDVLNQGLFNDITQRLYNEAQGISNYYISCGILSNTDFVAIDRYGADGASANTTNRVVSPCQIQDIRDNTVVLTHVVPEEILQNPTNGYYLSVVNAKNTLVSLPIIGASGSSLTLTDEKNLPSHLPTIKDINIGASGKILQTIAVDPGGASYPYFWNGDHWNNYLEFVRSVRDTTKKPIVLWQIPMGHLNQTLSVHDKSQKIITPLANVDGSWEDSAQTFFFGDVFKPGNWPNPINGAKRIAYFSQNGWNDPSISFDQTTGQSTWDSHFKNLANNGVIALLCAPGLGPPSSTYSMKLLDMGPFDNHWWITKVHNYFQNGPQPVN